ncbi:condensation domain-containing protein, partial [Myxococcus eversor]|uniref:condensation domain-containing protein n=1 Tax=Myxococcus eversor TaxID=2709661 RepID=UPI0013CF68A9
SPLFQVMLAVQNTPSSTLRLPGLTFRGIEGGSRVAKFDLSLTLAESPEGFVGSLDFCSDLFDSASITRLVEHLRTLLRSALAQPSLPVSSLSMMDEAEQSRVL